MQAADVDNQIFRASTFFELEAKGRWPSRLQDGCGRERLLMANVNLSSTDKYSIDSSHSSPARLSCSLLGLSSWTSPFYALHSLIRLITTLYSYYIFTNTTICITICKNITSWDKTILTSPSYIYSECIANVSKWMTQNKLQFNSNKTKAMLVSKPKFPLLLLPRWRAF